MTYSGADVRSAVWIRVARLWGVRLGMRQGDRRVGFDGFKREVSGVARSTKRAERGLGLGGLDGSAWLGTYLRR